MNRVRFSLGEFLDQVLDVETRREAYYAQIRDRSSDNNVRMLTYYLARHCRHQTIAFENILPETLQQARAAELNTIASFNPAPGSGFCDQAPDAIDGVELVENALAYNRHLLSLYRLINGQSTDEAVRSVISALSELEENDILMLKKMLRIHYF